MTTFRNIAASATVFYRDAFGKVQRGTANPLLLFADHVVIDRGNGQPVVVNARNYVRHTHRATRVWPIERDYEPCADRRERDSERRARLENEYLYPTR